MSTTAVGPNISSAKHVDAIASGRTKVRPYCALFALLLGAAISAQQPPSRFRAGVDLVTVDAVVLDKDGTPVPGLTRQDFEVEEDGRVQQITEFQSVELPPPSATPRPARPAPERRISFNSITAGHIPGRAFVLVFDDINLTRVQAAEGKKALRKFVETATTDEDSVSIITTSGGGWFHARTAADRQKLLALADREEGKYIEDTSAERMTDFEAMRITVFQDTTVAARVRRRYANYRVNGMQPVTTPGGVDDMPRIEETRGNVGVVEPYIESRASAVYSEIVARNRMTLGVLERALKALEDTRGRKSVVLLSKGFIYDPETRGFKAVSQAARRANVAIYFVDARGLVATTSNFTASEGSPIDPRDVGATFADIALDAEGAVSVAEDSGGFAIRNTNDLSAGLDRLSRESRSYYLLGYVPPNPRPDGKFRRISVKVKRPGLTVRARRGYFAPDAVDASATPPTADLDPEVRRALDSPRDVADLPVRATALVFDRVSTDAARVVIAADVDVKSFLFEPEEGGRSRGSVELAVAATRLDTGEVFHFEQTTAMNLKAETRDRLGVTWYSVSREFSLPSGAYQARVVIRDRTSGRIGSVTHAFDVPPLTGFRVSSPLLTDVLQTDPTGQAAPRPVLLARRTFRSGSTLYCQFTAYGAAAEGGTGKPRVSASWALQRGDGSLVREAPVTALVPGSDGSLARIYGISLAGLPPGDYELGLAVRDEIGVKLAELREPFTVERAVGIR